MESFETLEGSRLTGYFHIVLNIVRMLIITKINTKGKSSKPAATYSPKFSQN